VFSHRCVITVLPICHLVTYCRLGRACDCGDRSCRVGEVGHLHLHGEAFAQTGETAGTGCQTSPGWRPDHRVQAVAAGSLRPLTARSTDLSPWCEQPGARDWARRDDTSRNWSGTKRMPFRCCHHAVEVSSPSRANPRRRVFGTKVPGPSNAPSAASAIRPATPVPGDRGRQPGLV